jgi:putative chitinase
MKMSELLEDGRIVKGVNTTPDVDVNSISREAGKFGNKVDKDGKPPTLSKKVKGASTNVLYNLGLAEDVIMKESYKSWFKDKFGGDPEYKAWRRMYKNDPKKAKYTFGSKHKQFLATYVQAGNEKRFTAMEWACIEGGHDISDLQESKPKLPGRIFSALENLITEAPTSSPRPRLRPDSVTTDEPGSSLAPATSLRPQLRPNWQPNRHERLIVNNGKVRGMEDDEIAAMLAQIKVETGNFQYMTELGGEKYFQMYDPQHAPRKAAALGNTEPGDGYKYRGRGYLQITGRYNYEQASKAMPGGFTNFVDNPELVANPQIAVQLAFEYWSRRTAPNISNWDDVRSVTRTINPGLMHLADRQDAYKMYKLAVAMA